jgi:hypothetical protein
MWDVNHRRIGSKHRAGRRGPTARVRSPASPRTMLLFMGIALTLLAVPPFAALAQDVAGGTEGDTLRQTDARAVRALQAVRIQGSPPVIDGDLSDPVWQTAPVATDFVQVEPREGAPASERTEARILYDDEALYVAIRAFDSSPDSITAQLTRRDQHSVSDRVHVLIDSYFDRRTAFHFAVNPVGVKMDFYRYDDNREDIGWDAVWDVATRVDEEGWTAEFRIPLSQLRFSGAPVQTWGINFGRDIARRNELSVWAPISNRDPRVVSRFGELHGIRNLQPPSRIEVLPYTAASAARTPGDPSNPFWSSTDGAVEVGADLRFGVTSDLTLDLTVNPDFGQVEADPAQVNLTAFETFFPERRPFFQEGAGIFRFGIGLGDGDGEQEQLFYSRRIGRAPQGPSPQGDWVDRPSQTRILTAGKLSGKTDGGWSIGMLSALTGSASARAFLDGETVTHEVEPRTSYSVARLQKDFRDGASSVGGIATGTFRDGPGAGGLGLHRDAVTGGIDLRHRFRDETFEVAGYLVGSRVSGTPEVLEATQRSSARYFQRPDADHVSVDPSATSLTGWSGYLEVFKTGGGPLRFASLTLARSPGFEVNDLGFMPRADAITQVLWMGYLQTEPGERLRRWNLNTNIASGWTFGREHTGMSGNVNGSLTTHGNVGLWGGVNMNSRGLSTNLLRGGPAFRTERAYNGWNGFNTDGRRDWQLNLNGNWQLRPESDSWMMSVSPNLRWLPSERATIRFGPSFTRRVDDRQWVDRVPLDDEPAYVFGRMEQSTLALNIRAEAAVTPTLSLQLFAQPFVSAGSFTDFRRVTAPRAQRYADRFEPVDAEFRDGRFRVDLTGNGEEESFRNPNFNSLQFRSNAVLRWEYRPGSTLFLVWAQTRDHFDREGRFQVGRDLDDLFSARADNVFMVKVNYWLNP